MRQIKQNIYSPHRMIMRALTLVNILLACLISSFGQNKVSPEPENSTSLVFTVRTDKTLYVLGEPIVVTLTWENTSTQDFEMKTTTMMDRVSLYDEEEKRDLPYRGVIACGSGGYKYISAGEKFELHNVVNNFLFPNFDLMMPGHYRVRSDYASVNFEKRKNLWTGQLSASAAFKIVRLGEASLDREREKPISRDSLSLQILAAHGDTGIIPILAELVKSKDQEMRQIVYRTLLILNTEDSIRILAEAATTNIPPQERINILMSLSEIKPMPNPVVIFYMEKLLNDDYVGGYATTQNENEQPKRYKLYTVRKWAYLVLKKLNIEKQVVYEEEMKENQDNNKNQ